MPSRDLYCVPQCTSDRHAKKELLVLFHTLPKDMLLVKKWILVIRQNVGPKFQLLYDNCVCLKYFTHDQYCQGWKAKGACLKNDTVSNVLLRNSASCRCKNWMTLQLVPPSHLQFLQSKLQVDQQQVVDLQQRLESVDAMVKSSSSSER